MRGRVLAVDRSVTPAIAIVRGERADVRVTADGAWRPGDLVDDGRVVGAYAGTDFPSPQHETINLPKENSARV